MHFAWYITEIRWQILKHFSLPMRQWQSWYHPSQKSERQVRRSALVSLARTCTILSDDALDLLWESMYSLIPLLRLIPGFHEDVLNPSLAVSELTSACLERYLSYSRRVHHFRLRPPPEELEEAEYLAISSALPSNDAYLLPNLRMLHLHTGSGSFHVLPFLSHPSTPIWLTLTFEDSLETEPEIVQHLTRTQSLTHLYIPNPAGMPTTTPALSDIIIRSPSLKYLSLDTDPHSLYIETGLMKDLARVHPALVVFECNGCNIHDVFQILNLAHHSLERVRIKAYQDISQAFSGILLAPGGFPVLQEFHVRLDHPGSRLLEALCRTQLPSLRAFSLADVGDSKGAESRLSLVGDFLCRSPAIGKQLEYLTLSLPVCLPDSVKTFWAMELNRLCSNLSHLALSFRDADYMEERGNGVIGVEVPPLTTLRHLRICHPLAVLESGWRELADRIKFPVLEMVEVHSDTKWVEVAKDKLKACAIELVVWDPGRRQIQQMERWSTHLRVGEC